MDFCPFFFLFVSVFSANGGSFVYFVSTSGCSQLIYTHGGQRDVFAANTMRMRLRILVVFINFALFGL